mgnify:CR=1 FL=1
MNNITLEQFQILAIMNWAWYISLDDRKFKFIPFFKARKNPYPDLVIDKHDVRDLIEMGFLEGYKSGWRLSYSGKKDFKDHREKCAERLGIDLPEYNEEEFETI